MKNSQDRRASPSDLFIPLCGCCVLLICFGLAYSMPVFFTRLANRFAIPLWHLAAFFSIGGAAFFGIGGLTGILADRYGSRAVVAIGLLVLASGLVVSSVAETELTFALGYIVGVGIGVGMIYVPVTASVQSLCAGDRAIAAGITSAGIGLGALICPPATEWVIHVWDGRIALQMMATLAVVGILPALPLRKVEKKPTAAPVSLRSNRRFGLMYVAQALVSAVCFVPFAHLVSLATQNGWSVSVGVQLISLVGVGSTAGRFGIAAIPRRFGVFQTASASVLLMAVAMLGLGTMHFRWLVCLDMFGFGVGYGGLTALTAPIAVEICGPIGVGKTVGVLTTSRAFGMLFGPWAVAVGVTWFKGYMWPLVGCSLVATMSAICINRCACRPEGSEHKPTERLYIPNLNFYSMAETKKAVDPHQTFVAKLEELAVQVGPVDNISDSQAC